MGFMAPVFSFFGSLFASQVFIGAIISTAVSTLASLIFAPKKPKGQALEATPYTRREIGGTTPVIVGRRKAYGVEVFRKNESLAGQSSKQFFQILYSVGPVGFLYDIRVFGEKNIFSLGNEKQNTSVIDYRYGADGEQPTGHGWSDIAADGTYASRYDSLGLQCAPDSPHPVRYLGRAGVNIFMAADTEGRSGGMNVQVESVVRGLTCRRFTNSGGDMLCHVGPHNQWVEIYHNNTRYAGSVVAGTYTASQLAAAAETALNLAEDDAGNAHLLTITVTYDTGTDTFTIACDTDDVRLLTWSGSYAECALWDDLGMLRGARYGFNPKTSGGTDFLDLRLSSTTSITSSHPFTKPFTRNPIRICYELRTNPAIAPGIESPGDFDQAAMLVEEQYCNEIVSVNGRTQYDIVPRNILPDLARIYGVNTILAGTVGDPAGLINLIDGNYSNPAPAAEFFNGETLIPQIGWVSRNRKISKIVIRTDAVSKSFKVQYIPWGTLPEDLQVSLTRQVNYFHESDWVDAQAVTNSTDETITIEFDPDLECNAIRFCDLSSASGEFVLYSVQMVQVYTANLGFGQTAERERDMTKTFMIQVHEIDVKADANQHQSGFVIIGEPSGLNALKIASNTLAVRFTAKTGGTGLSGQYYKFLFPFKRRIGLIAIFTTVGAPQSYTIQFLPETGGTWTTLVARTDQKGTDYIFFEPQEMVAFAITDMSSGFSISEVEAFDAIPSVRYTLDAVIEDATSYKDNLLKLYESAFLIPCEELGKQSLKVERDEIPVEGIYGEHILDAKKTPMPRREKVNQWNFRYSNELKEYEPDIYSVDDYAAQLRPLTYPGGGSGAVRNTREVEFFGVSRPLQMARMGHVIQRRASYADWVYTLSCLPGAVTASVGSVIKIEYPELRLSKLARITRKTLREDLSSEIECSLHVPGVYADEDITPDDIAFYKDAGDGPAYTGDAIITDTTPETGSDGDVAEPRLVVSFTPPEDSVSKIRAYVNRNNEVDSSGDRVYRLAATAKADAGKVLIPIDTAGSVNDIYTTRIVLQAVREGGLTKSVQQLDQEYDLGISRSAMDWSMILDEEADLNYYNILAALNELILLEKREALIVHTPGDPDRKTVPAYRYGSVEVRYREGGKLTKYSSSMATDYDYKEFSSTEIEFKEGFLDEDYEQIFVVEYFPA